MTNKKKKIGAIKKKVAADPVVPIKEITENHENNSNDTRDFDDEKWFEN